MERRGKVAWEKKKKCRVPEAGQSMAVSGNKVKTTVIKAVRRVAMGC